MTYVYDIVLNFNSDLFEFYEWKNDDIVLHIKRINLILVNSKSYNEILDNIVVFNNDFLISIFNRCEYYTNRNVKTIPYAVLLTDSYRVIAIILDKKGKTIKYSSLLLDEEEEVLETCHNVVETKLKYHIETEKNKNDFQTRDERKIITYIKNDLIQNYQKGDINKLKYLYYEYFNKQSDNIEQIYQDLLFELKKGINKRHYDLYTLIKLSYSGKNVKN